MGLVLVIKYLEKFILVLFIPFFFFDHRWSKRSEPTQVRQYTQRDWEQGGLIKEEETAYEE